MKPNTMIIFMAVLIALGFGALLYFQNQQMQALSQSLGISPATPAGQQPAQTVVSATPQTSSSGIPSQQILVLGGAIPAGTGYSGAIPSGTQAATTTTPTQGPVGGQVTG